MNTSDIISVIAVIAALIAFPFTYYLGHRNRQVPDLRYAMDFDVILNPDDRLLGHDLQMTIGGNQIKCISRTRIAFWNQRGDTVRGTDIVPSDPVRIEFAEGDKPLQVRTLSRSRKQTNLRASINPANPATVDIQFNFLDAGDGAIFEVVHQGMKSPSLPGTIMGAKKHNNGSSHLNPETLAAFSKKPRLLRIRKGAISLIGLSLGFVGLTAFILWLAFSYHAPVGYTIDSRHFNLNSIRGQGDFANAVYNSNNPYTQTGTIPVLIGIMALTNVTVMSLGVSAFKEVTKARIPYSIAREKQ